MRLRAYLILAGAAVLLVSFGFAFSAADAGSSLGGAAEVWEAPSGQAEDDACLACHSQAGFSVQLDGGETLPLTVDPDLYEESTHGSNAVTCVTCHSDIEGFPHPERTAETLREFRLENYTACRQCHVEQFDQSLDSVHQMALAGGDTNAAVCTDCHNPHTQQPLTNKETGSLFDSARLHIPETCAQCHSVIYDTYKESVHGRALTEEGNLDVPTCVDCHGVHNIQSPATATFRNSTPFLCAECHTDGALMQKYDLSTEVLNTYVADFHGTTVVLFDKSFPDQPTNKPVCTDCHGVHDIARAEDPEKGLRTRENLLARCQVCHPDATANFPDSWMSHYIPSPEKYPIVYYVNLFYKFFIPAVLGPMVLLVVMDFGRAMINRFKGKKPVMPVVAPAEPSSESAVVSGTADTPEPEIEPEETPAPEQVDETTTAVEPDLEAESEPKEEVTAAEPQEESQPEQADESPVTEGEEQPEAVDEPDQSEAESEPPVESKLSDEEENSNGR